MEDPLLVPTSQISTSDGGNPEDLRPGDDTPWQSNPSDPLNPHVTIQLSQDGAPIQIGDVAIPKETRDNIKTIEIFIQGPNDDNPQAYNPENPTSNNPKVKIL